VPDQRPQTHASVRCSQRRGYLLVFPGRPGPSVAEAIVRCRTGDQRRPVKRFVFPVVAEAIVRCRTGDLLFAQKRRNYQNMVEDHAFTGVGECHLCREFEGMQPSRYMNTSLASATGVSPWVSTATLRRPSRSAGWIMFHYPNGDRANVYIL